MKHKTGIILLIIGGALMVVGNAIGTIGVFEFLQGWAVANAPTNLIPLVNLVMIVIKWIADQGGWTIIGGAILIMIGLKRIGKFVIWIGLTFGLIALIVWIITQVINFTGISLGPTVDPFLAQIYGLFTYNTGFAFLGTTLSVIGKACVKDVAKAPKPQETVLLDSEPAVDNLKNKYCPNCGSIVPIEANFCNQCGTNF